MKKKKKAGKPQLKTPAQLRAHIKFLRAELDGTARRIKILVESRIEFDQERMRMKLYADACERRFLAIRALVNDNGR